LPEGVNVDEVSSSVNVTIMWGDGAQVASFTGIFEVANPVFMGRRHVTGPDVHPQDAC
jgi:hypothetical protein